MEIALISEEKKYFLLQEFKKDEDDLLTPVQVRGITAVTSLLKKTTESTVHAIISEIQEACKILVSEMNGHVALDSSVVTKCIKEDSSSTQLLENVIHRANNYIHHCIESRRLIANNSLSLFRDDTVILTHGYSRVVTHLLKQAAKSFRFKVIVTESKLFHKKAGVHVAKELSKSNIPVKLIPDSAVGYIMERIDFCLVGAELVMENGGIVNRIGTNNLAYLAKAWNKPFYSASESYKFTRMYPLHQTDFPNKIFTSSDKDVRNENYEEINGTDVDLEFPSNDFTPPELITLMFTDIGVLTPSAVGDELIKLYH